MEGSEIQIKAQLNWHTRSFKLPLSGMGDYETLKIIIRSVFNLDDNSLFLIEYSHANEFYFISSQENLWQAIDRTLGKELSLYITEYDEISSDVPNNATTNVDEPTVNENLPMEQVVNEEPVPVIVKPSEEIKSEVKVEDEDIPIIIKPSEDFKSEVKIEDIEESQPSEEKKPEIEEIEQLQSSNDNSEVKKPDIIPTVVETKVESQPEVIASSSSIKENEGNIAIASTSKGKEAEITEDLSSVSEASQKVTVDQSSQTENSQFANMSIRDIVRQSINLQTDAYRKIVENIKNQTREDADIVQNITNIIANEYPNEINQIKQTVKDNIERHNEECKKVVESLRNQTRNNADVVQNIVNTISNECRNQYPEEIRQIRENIRRTTNFINRDVQEAVNKITNVIDQYSTYKNIFLGDILDQLDRRDQNNSTSNASSNNTTTGANPTSNSSSHQPLNQTDETLENVKDFFNSVAMEIKLGVDTFLDYIDEKEERINNVINGMNESTNSGEAVTTNETSAAPEAPSNVNEASVNQDLPISSNETSANVDSINQTPPVSSNDTSANVNSINQSSPVSLNNVSSEATSSTTTETPAPPNDNSVNRNNSVPQDPVNSVRNIFNNIASEIRIGVDNFLDYLDEKDEMITNFILGPYNEFDMMESNNSNNNNNNNNNDNKIDNKNNDNNQNINTNETKINEVTTKTKPATTTPANAVVTEINVESSTTPAITEEESSSNKYEEPVIQGRNDTEHSNHYFIEQFNKYKEEYSRKKLEEKKAQEAQQGAEAEVPEVAETIETAKTPLIAETTGITETVETTKIPEIAETAEIVDNSKTNETIETVETQPKQSEQSVNNKEVKEEKPTPLSQSRSIFNTVKNTLLDGITSFATSSRFVDDGFLGVPIERDPTTEVTENTENTTTINDTPTEEGPVIEMKQVSLSEYEKTDNTNDASVATREVEEFSNGIIIYNDLEEVEKQHPSIVKNPIKTSANRIIDEEMSAPVSEDSFDYHSYSPTRPEDNTNLNVSENVVKNERTEDELELLRVQMSYENDTFPNDHKRESLNDNNANVVIETPPTPDSTHDPDYYMKKGKQIFEEEYKKGKDENSEEIQELMDVEFIQIEDANDNEESTYDNKAQGRPVSSSKKAQEAKKQFETYEFDIYDDPEVEKRIKQKKQETDLLDEYEII